jgi:hypothetical protein
MSVERGTCQDKIKFFIFLWKKFFQKNLNIPLKQAWKMVLLVKILLNRPKGLSRNGGFSSKKRPFSEANISKKKADFGSRPHQSKIWIFYSSRIPSLGGGRTNAWPRKSIWSEPTSPLPKMFKYTMNSGGSRNFLGIIWFTVL